MSVLVDTSALYAVFDRADEHHERAAAAWRSLLENGEQLITTSYILVELIALLQRRLGVDAVRGFDGGVAPLLDVIVVDEELHNEGMTALTAADRRDVSLVDWVSFRAMRRRGIQRAFALDADFEKQGFQLIPS